MRNIPTYVTGHSVTLAGSLQWSNYSGSVPLDDIALPGATMRPKIGGKPNLCIMPDLVHQKFRRHPQVLDALGSDNVTNGRATRDGVPPNTFGMCSTVRPLLGHSDRSILRLGAPVLLSLGEGSFRAHFSTYPLFFLISLKILSDLSVSESTSESNPESTPSLECS